MEELEIVAHSGELERIPGIGTRRAEAIRNSVGALLNRSGRRRGFRRRGLTPTAAPGEDTALEGDPPVEVILKVDAEYRRKATAGRLKTIAPRRFNPEGKAWLPILHTEERLWHFTALYSNTARAHDLDRIHDWMVIYYDRDGMEGRCTVVTEPSGPLQGRRVIRGRERECRNHYD